MESGKNSIRSKFDVVSAYKNVPCQSKDVRLQGFLWGCKFFVDDSQMFGAETAVANHDTLGNTAKSLSLAVSSIPKKLVHRQLDDVPVVALVSTGWCAEFSKNFFFHIPCPWASYNLFQLIDSKCIDATEVIDHIVLIL